MGIRMPLMTLTITSQVIRGTGTHHVAAATSEGGWAVTWLPGRTLTRSQAITAMLFAQAAVQDPAADRAWPHVGAWAAELGLSGSVALSLAVNGRGGARAEGNW
jgi:hypothetical protein